ncbi:MAG: L-fucose/L-arabinose isomerase family protein [Bacillota bacterium]
MEKQTFGLIVGNRGFFPNHLCESGRREMIDVLEGAGFGVICLTPEDTPFGSVESLADARKCGRLFEQHRDKISGIIVTLPNFGDERGVAGAIRFSGLKVPVLIQAYPDEPGKMSIENRRDSFCGKISACNNLRQHGIPFSLTASHTEPPQSGQFQRDLSWFAGVCRVVNGLKNIRLGALGARPAAFNTVRFSEKILEQNGISIETLDLSEAFGRIDRLPPGDPAVREKLAEIQAYIPCGSVPSQALEKMSKLGVVIDRWRKTCDLAGIAVQCWTSMEEYLGIVPCTVLSMLSGRLIPAACEVDVPGLLGMYALQLASGQPSALVDWNNNYGDDPDLAVVFHCSNLPANVFNAAEMGYQLIIAGTVGKDNTHGTVCGRIKSGPFTFARTSTDDFSGTVAAYVGEGAFTGDPLETFGGYGVARISNLQKLLKYICENGFEHHVAFNPSSCADILAEAFSKYLGWSVYRHK